MAEQLADHRQGFQMRGGVTGEAGLIEALRYTLLRSTQVCVHRAACWSGDCKSMMLLNVYGTVRLKDGDDQDCSPRSQKALALLILVAVSPSKSRTRRWLQETLWSDRSGPQAAGSLRNALSEIRKSLGRHEGLLKADRQWIALDSSLFRINYERPVHSIGKDIEPFDDVNVNDPECHKVFRELRAQIREKCHRIDALKAVNAVAQGCLPSVLICLDVQSAPHVSGAHAVYEYLISQLTNLTGVNVYGTDRCDSRSDGEHPAIGRPLGLRIRSVASGVHEHLMIQLDEATTGQLIWCGSANVPLLTRSLNQSLELSRMCVEAIEAVYRTLCDRSVSSDLPVRAWQLAKQAQDVLFNLDRRSFNQADELLARAYEIEPRGRYLAWRGFLRDLANFQHRDAVFLKDSTPAHEFSTQALRDDPNDPVVLTFASQLEYIVQGNAQTSLRMVERSLDLDASNPLSWAVLSNALVAQGRADEGYQAAERALTLAWSGRTYFYFEHFACMAAAACLEYDLARAHAGSALVLRPDFVSARRYQLALALQNRDAASALVHTNALRTHEPQFTAVTLLDPSYPVNTMRRLPLIDAVR